MLKDKRPELSGLPLTLIKDALVVNRASCALSGDGGSRAEAVAVLGRDAWPGCWFVARRGGAATRLGAQSQRE